LSGADCSEIERLDEAGCRCASVTFDQLVPWLRVKGLAQDLVLEGLLAEQDRCNWRASCCKARYFRLLHGYAAGDDGKGVP